MSTLENGTHQVWGDLNESFRYDYENLYAEYYDVPIRSLYDSHEIKELIINHYSHLFPESDAEEIRYIFEITHSGNDGIRLAGNILDYSGSRITYFRLIIRQVHYSPGFKYELNLSIHSN